MRPALLALVLLSGCARVHYAPAPAPDAGALQCVRWWADPAFPEDARCVEWAGDDGGPQGCTLEPVYRIGDPVRCAVSRSEDRDR